jgi:hypothetical protein
MEGGARNKLAFGIVRHGACSIRQDNYDSVSPSTPFRPFLTKRTKSASIPAELMADEENVVDDEALAYVTRLQWRRMRHYAGRLNSAHHCGASAPWRDVMGEMGGSRGRRFLFHLVFSNFPHRFVVVG